MMMVMVMMRKGKLMKSEMIFIEKSIFIEELFDLIIVYVNEVFLLYKMIIYLVSKLIS